MQNQRPIPVFFAVDDSYAPCLAVALRSLIDNASAKDRYNIHILVDTLTESNRQKLISMATDTVSITFTDVREKLSALRGKLHLRDYYTSATYYRFFIPALFPQYDRGVYLDCDIAVLGNLADLYNCPIGNNLVAAIPDEVVLNIPVFTDYAEKALGIPRQEYFNAGILVMNLKEMRRVHLESALEELMQLYTFRVAQDQDYLNVLCHGKTTYLDIRWNKTAFPGDDRIVTPYIAHYKLSFKPWHYTGVAYEEHFWKYAENTPYLQQLLNTRQRYTQEQRHTDDQQYDGLVALAQAEIRRAARSADKLPVQHAVCHRREK